MSARIFETRYRDKLWRIRLSEHDEQRRISIWPFYQDWETGNWKACGGKHAPGFFVESDRADEFAATLTALAKELRSTAS